MRVATASHNEPRARAGLDPRAGFTMADVTEQTPLAAPRPKSRKRIVAATAVLSVALGYSAVRAVDRRFLAFSGPDPVQIRLREDMRCREFADRE